MKTTLLTSFWLLATGYWLLATENQPLGSRSSGLGNASVSLADVWAVQNNQAGLGFQKTFIGGVVYQNPFMMKELSTKALALALPVKGGTFGILVSTFGYPVYNETKAGLSFGKSFGEKISAGISLDYFGTNISEYGKKNSFVAEAGIQAKPLKNFTIGAHIFNLAKAKLVSYNDERIPTIMRLGFDYKFSEKVFIAVETEKDIEKKAMIKAGLEYKLIKELFLRAGVSSNPSLSCFGIGVNLKQFRLDISSTYHSTLGFSPQVGLIYQFEKEK
ncbi:MAG: hypothetical protein HY841_07965 [Bacteroidetes bacterium]|nr:hypothetical protein [Bacteroidota bacterium]